MPVGPSPEVQELFEAALELSAEERFAFLARECRDHAIHRDVTSLLEAFDRAPGFFDEPAFELGRDDFDDSSLAGERLGAYELYDVLGEGGMGTVWRGLRVDRQFSRQVAVKVLKRGLDTAELLARFRTERQTLATLQHPNIVALLDAGSMGDGRPYVVMEYVDGTPIDRYCDAGGLGLSERLALFRQVTSAVSHAHQRLIVHRDLKPSNILVTADGGVKLLDFGIAKILGEGPQGDSTRTGRRAPMTLRYASPEQVGGEPVTTATDVYSLGVLLFELLAGRSPYGDCKAEALERAVLERDPEPPSAVAPAAQLGRALRGDLDTIVLYALRKEPERRYPSVERLAEDLDRYRGRLPLRARPDTFLYRAGKLLRRRRLEVAALALVMAALAWAAVASRLGLERATRGERIAWQAHADAVFVTNYLADVLERAGRGELGSEAEVLDVLRDAEGRIARDLAQAPEAEARLRFAVGRVYAALERWDSAESHARRALELSRSTHGLGWTDVARNLDLLAHVLTQRHDGEAVAVRRESLELYRERLGDEHARTRKARELLDQLRADSP